MDELLTRTETRHSTSRVMTVDQALMQAWTRYINTPAYRALMEILAASRTDEMLKKRLSSELLNWGHKLDDQTRQLYEALSGDDDEAIMLLNMTRSFMRGLLIQERYGVTQEQTSQYVRKWIELVAPLLKLRG